MPRSTLLSNFMPQHMSNFGLNNHSQGFLCSLARKKPNQVEHKTRPLHCAVGTLHSVIVAKSPIKLSLDLFGIAHFYHPRAQIV